MYRKPKFLEVLHGIREGMSREADYDMELFAEMVRSGRRPAHGPERNVRGFRSRAPRADDAQQQQQSPAAGAKPRRKRAAG
jgi:hypothetical protein